MRWLDRGLLIVNDGREDRQDRRQPDHLDALLHRQADATGKRKPDHAADPEDGKEQEQPGKDSG